VAPPEPVELGSADVRQLIVDGYNLLLSVPRYADDAARDMDVARERLIADLGARAASGQRITVVFDGGANPDSDGEPLSVGGVDVIFSPAGTDADSVIEALAARAREAGDETEVVTSDAATRTTASGGAVTVTRSSSFARELALDELQWRESHEAPHERATIADRVDDDTRSRLDRLAGRKHRPSGM
jgi:predicted RNA-binding protein with PIN domain